MVLKVLSMMSEIEPALTTFKALDPVLSLWPNDKLCLR